MKKCSFTLIIISCFFGGIISLSAQPVNQGQDIQVGISEKDPIVSMLDSLVSLNYLSRYNFSSVQNSKNIGSVENPYYSDEVYKSRLDKLESPIPLDYNQQVRNYIDLYLVKKRELTSRVMGLSQLYFPLFEEVLDQQNLPLEFKYLAIVESALNPVAVSKAGATGIWQFMYGTAKMYDLKIDSYIDERRDPHKATLAACEYFKDMYKIYKDWLLVIAAYNCGPRNVNKAIIRSGGKTNFWEISRYLPQETRGYVPAFVAVNYVMNYALEHNIAASLPVINYFEVDTISVNQETSLDHIASVINTPLPILQYLNPVFKKNYIPSAEEAFVLRLPSNKAGTFIANAEAIFNKYKQAENLLAMEINSAQAISTAVGTQAVYVTKEIKKTHVVKSGEYLSGIANKYNCTLSEVKNWNRLKSTTIYPGQKIVVYVTVKQKVELVKVASAKAADSQAPGQPVLLTSSNDSVTTQKVHKSQPTTVLATTKTSTEKSSSEKVKYIYHVIQPGDTLWDIAQRYEGVTVKQLKETNRISDTKGLKVGTKLKVVISG